jgi:hypothetical protein
MAKQKDKLPGSIENRIIGQGEEAPDQLLANPNNWRRHPKHQQEALESMLRTVGWVQRVIVNKTTGHIVDGHLRVEVALRRNEPIVPVLYVELSPDEEKVVLAAIDPIGGLAETDQAMLDELLDGVVTGDAGMDAFLDGLRGATVGEIELPKLNDGDREPFQQMTFTVHDEQKDQIDRALEAAKRIGPFSDGLNDNSNGNALARVCELFLGKHGG